MLAFIGNCDDSLAINSSSSSDSKHQQHFNHRYYCRCINQRVPYLEVRNTLYIHASLQIKIHYNRSKDPEQIEIHYTCFNVLKKHLKKYFSMIDLLGIHTKHSRIESNALMWFEGILLQVNRNAFAIQAFCSEKSFGSLGELKNPNTKRSYLLLGDASIIIHRVPRRAMTETSCLLWCLHLTFCVKVSKMLN